MDKRKMAILGKAFESEVYGALNHTSGLMQTRSKLADELVSDGMLTKESETLGMDRLGIIQIEGYRLTHAGRLIYCSSC